MKEATVMAATAAATIVALAALIALVSKAKPAVRLLPIRVERRRRSR
jgi:hypothetical protein